jgi:riboflavin transporter FmnP
MSMARKYHTGSYLVSVIIASKCMTHGMLRLMYYFIVIMPYYMIKAHVIGFQNNISNVPYKDVLATMYHPYLNLN